MTVQRTMCHILHLSLIQQLKESTFHTCLVLVMSLSQMTSLISTGMVQSWQGVTWTALSDTLSALRWGKASTTHSSTALTPCMCLLPAGHSYGAEEEGCYSQQTVQCLPIHTICNCEYSWWVVADVVWGLCMTIHYNTLYLYCFMHKLFNHFKVFWCSWYKC